MTDTNHVDETSELAQQFTQVVNFMQRRADIRATLMANKPKHNIIDQSTQIINSLSKIKNSNNKNPQKNNIENPNVLPQLIQQLAEQLNEGHTVLILDTQNTAENQLYNSLKNSQWVHQLVKLANPSTDSVVESINKPIIMQVLPEISPNDNENTTIQNRVVVWLHRQWYAERQLALQLLAIAQRSVNQLIATPSNNIHTVHHANPRQQLAISNAYRYALSIITGGPGTGKTFTVAQLVIALQYAHNAQKKLNPYLPPLSIALTAPTGKAAQRMQESLLQNLQGEKIELDNAKTLHRLLGIGSNGMPRYHHDNPLPDDLVIVDEASMLGLELASQLVDAIKPTGRLILLGDANQLAAVDAGAVLADLCAVEALQPYRTELTESRRFDDTSAIGQLSTAIKQSANSMVEKKQKIQAIKKLLNPKNTPESPVSFYKIAPTQKSKTLATQTVTDYRQLYQQLSEPFGAFFVLTKALLLNPLTIADVQPTQAVTAQAENKIQQSITAPQSSKAVDEMGELEKLFGVFDNYRILSAGHHGNLGDTAINQAISHYHKRKVLNLPLSDSYFYHGQPIMMLTNDYQLGVFNGDIGICLLVEHPNDTHPLQLMACFVDKVIDISRLNTDSCTTAYALTIHKSQGSEFGHVAVCLDNKHIRLLSQELIYTAVTRSKQKLDIYSNEMVLQTALVQRGNRQTGLTLQF